MPGVVAALSTVHGRVSLAPLAPPSVVLDLCTVLAEVNTQLLERLLRFVLAVRKVQLAEEAYSCTELVLPPPSPASQESTPFTLPLSLSIWLNDVALFVVGDTTDVRPSTPLLKLSVPLAALLLAPYPPHVIVKIHDAALTHMGEAERGECYALLLLLHLCIYLTTRPLTLPPQ